MKYKIRQTNENDLNVVEYRVRSLNRATLLPASRFPTSRHMIDEFARGHWLNSLYYKARRVRNDTYGDLIRDVKELCDQKSGCFTWCENKQHLVRWQRKSSRNRYLLTFFYWTYFTYWSLFYYCSRWFRLWKPNNS